MPEITKRTYSEVNSDSARIEWARVIKDYTQNRENIEFSDTWSTVERAREYWSTAKTLTDFYCNILADIPVFPGSRVLDIGGGPGNLAIPIACLGGEVVVVEPSKVMVNVLCENLKEHIDTRITVIPKRWEDVSDEEISPPFDIVLASYSLGMLDIKEAVLKMCRASRSRVYLVWSSGITAWESIAYYLWPRIHNTQYLSLPKSNLLYDVLYEMNIYPNVISRKVLFEEWFATIGQAEDSICKRSMATASEQKSIVRDYVNHEIRPKCDGWVLGRYVTRTIFWWDITKQGKNEILQGNKGEQ